MTNFEPADEDMDDPIHGMLAMVLSDWHQPLHEAGVKIGILYASNADDYPLKRGGVPCAATIRVMSHKDRVKWHYDAELAIDAMQWGRMDDPSRMALLDHECSHLELKLDDQGDEAVIDVDSLGRPKLRSIPGNLNCSDGFIAVIERHGPAALEAVSARNHMLLIEEALRRWVPKDEV